MGPIAFRKHAQLLGQKDRQEEVQPEPSSAEDQIAKEDAKEEKRLQEPGAEDTP